MSEPVVSWNDFEKIDVRAGTIISAEPFPKAKKPAYKIVVDFGDAGIKKTSAQVTTLYSVEELVGKQVIGIINFPPRQVADFMSEFLILGVMDSQDVILLQPERQVKNGLKIG